MREPEGGTKKWRMEDGEWKSNLFDLRIKPLPDAAFSIFHFPFSISLSPYGFGIADEFSELLLFTFAVDDKAAVAVAQAVERRRQQ